MALMQLLADLTEQRPIEEIAAECDVIFSDLSIGIGETICDHPFRSALDSAKTGKTVLWIGGGFFSIVYPDARFMQSLRLYQESERQGI